MPVFEYFTEDLLQPISEENPGGMDLRYDLRFSEIVEARRSDEELNEGDWTKEGGRKTAEWERVASLCIGALRDRTKDLRIAAYLTEAAIRLDGFSGLRDCLRLTKELLIRFWDKGLFPAIEDNDLEYRASSLIWLNERMPELLSQVAITARVGSENYGLTRYQQAQRVGSEGAGASAGAEKRDTIQGLIRQGWITMDKFEAALRATKRNDLEAIYVPFDEADRALQEFEKIVDEKFGEAAPTFTSTKETIVAIRKVLAPALKRKTDEEPVAVTETVDGEARPAQFQSAATFFTLADAETAAASGKDWVEAELMLRSGQVDQALGQMASLSSQEPSGRGRFLRKLTLSDVCLRNGRDRLARAVLEELNQQIEEFKLDRWESSGLIGPVWSRLYKLYKKTGESSDLDQAAALYKRLCHLDPWQAYLSCED